MIWTLLFVILFSFSKLFLDQLARFCCLSLDHQVFAANNRDTTKRFRLHVDVRQRLDVVAIPDEPPSVLLDSALEV